MKEIKHEISLWRWHSHSSIYKTHNGDHIICEEYVKLALGEKPMKAVLILGNRRATSKKLRQYTYDGHYYEMTGYAFADKKLQKEMLRLSDISNKTGSKSQWLTAYREFTHAFMQARRHEPDGTPYVWLTVLPCVE